MRAVVQRVDKAKVTVNGKIVGEISRGLMVLVGVVEGDTEKDVQYLADKVTGLRIFEDEAEKMNLSVKDIGGEILSVSQFTLYGDCRKGKRPSFDKAAKPETAIVLYEKFNELCRQQNIKVETGVFGAHMLVEFANNGPVTILLDSSKIF